MSLQWYIPRTTHVICGTCVPAATNDAILLIPLSRWSLVSIFNHFFLLSVFFCRIIDSYFIRVGYAVRHNECWIALPEYQGQEALCAPSKFNEEKNCPVDTWAYRVFIDTYNVYIYRFKWYICPWRAEISVWQKNIPHKDEDVALQDDLSRSLPQYF